LLRVIARAHHIQAHLIQNPKLTVHDIAWLAPDITRAIINGRKPRQLTAQTLMSLTLLSAGRAEQRKLVGFR
jgi:site-specific DNA recombinase